MKKIGALIWVFALCGVPAISHSQDVAEFNHEQADKILDETSFDVTDGQTCGPGKDGHEIRECARVRDFWLAKDDPPTTRKRNPVVPLQFAIGSVELSRQSQRNLDVLAASLRSPKHGGKRIRISGHTDRLGSRKANQRLSQRRAQAVAHYLAKHGVDEGRLEAVGKADRSPLAGVSPFDATQRRVEVIPIRPDQGPTSGSARKQD